MLGEMYPVGLCLHILPDAPASLKQVLGGTLYGVFGSIRLFILNVTKQAGFRSKSCGIGRLAKLMGIPIMRTITATTAFKVPLYGISLPVSISSELLTEASKHLLNNK